MSKFIVSEELVNYFIVEADSEEDALDRICYREPHSLKPEEIIVTGYETVDPKLAPFYVVLTEN